MVRNFDLKLYYDASGKLKGPLVQMFPSVKWENYKDMSQENDLILIGPRIGIVVIKVKASQFQQKKHFKEGKPYLPNTYKVGIVNLHSSNKLVELLQECTDIQVETEKCHCKIFFTPGLSRARYENWKATLTGKKQNALEEKTRDIVKLFSEDAATVANLQA